MLSSHMEGCRVSTSSVPISNCGLLLNVNKHFAIADNKKFCKQMKEIVDTNLAKDYAVVDRIINDLRSPLNAISQTINCQCYGSYATGLACKDSDVDLFYGPFNNPVEIGEKIDSVLSKNRSKFKDIQFIKDARIPLLEFTHVDTGKKCSITFCNEMGVATSKLTKYYVTLCSKTKYLTLYLKHLLKKYDFQGTSGPSNKITTHMIFWLVVFLMQQEELLPSVYKVREMVPVKYDVLGWDCRVPAKVSVASKKKKISLYYLLLDFLKFYGDLDFLKYVLSPYMARAFTTIEVESSELPRHEFSVYWKKLSDNIEDDFQTFPIHVMNLQDATNHCYNLTKQLDQSTVNQFKWFCYKLYVKLSKNRGSKLLEKMLPISIEKEYINSSPNFVQVISIHWKNFDNEPSVNPAIKQDASCFLNDVRKVMENRFNFQRTSLIYNDDISRIITKRVGNVFERTIIPYVVFYLEYISTRKVFIRCEINKESETIDMFVQGEVQFTESFKENLKEILCSMNKKK